MRLVIAKRRGLRGEGLGNEMFSWAKGWLASQALDAVLIGPAWGLNPRRYYRNFRTLRWDFLWEEAGKLLPHFTFTEQDYRYSGQIDFGAAISCWAQRTGLQHRRHYIVTVDGMYGGYPAIASARNFLLHKLLASRNCISNLYGIYKTLNPQKALVVVHVRLGGGFHPAETDQDVRGRFNVSVPDRWYWHVCERLRSEFPDGIQFFFLSNDSDSQVFRELVTRFNPDQVPTTGLNECSDLLLMSQADLRVCSVSSYSLAASFLSQGPYLWYEPQLSLHEGIYSLWPFEAAQQANDSLTSQSQRFAKECIDEGVIKAMGDNAPLCLGTAMNEHDALPKHLVHCLRQRLRSLDRRTDLLHYGAVPRGV